MVEPVSVKREFLVERQGKQFVLYAGLLDLAHSQGLRRITTRIVQLPSEDNNQTAVCTAEVETDRGIYSGIGDASPSNVARAMLTAIIRLAETRAKARALRDAVNVGVAALEETGDTVAGDYDDHQPGTARAAAPTVTHRPTEARAEPAAPRASYPANGNGALATPAQVRAIYSIARDQHKLSEPEADERSVAMFGATPAELTRKQASELISSMQGNRNQ